MRDLLLPPLMKNFSMKKDLWAQGARGVMLSSCLPALFVLSVIAVQSLSFMLTWIATGFDAAAWTNYIIIVAFILGVVGFFWLLVTRRRYD